MDAKVDLGRIIALVIDENRHARALIKSVLESFGVHTVIEASDGAVGFDILRDRRVDVVITGLAMPYMNGLQLTYKLRTSNETADPHVPVVLISDRADRELVIKAKRVGVQGFLLTPITAGALMEQVRRAVADRTPSVAAQTQTVQSAPLRRRSPVIPRPTVIDATGR